MFTLHHPTPCEKPGAMAGGHFACILICWGATQITFTSLLKIRNNAAAADPEQICSDCLPSEHDCRHCDCPSLIAVTEDIP